MFKCDRKKIGNRYVMDGKKYIFHLYKLIDLVVFIKLRCLSFFYEDLTIEGSVSKVMMMKVKHID